MSKLLLWYSVEDAIVGLPESTERLIVLDSEDRKAVVMNSLDAEDIESEVPISLNEEIPEDDVSRAGRLVCSEMIIELCEVIEKTLLVRLCMLDDIAGVR